MEKGPLRWSGALVAFWILFWASAVGMRPIDLLEPVSAVSVVVAGLGLTIASHGTGCIPLTLRAIFGLLPPEDREVARLVAGTAGKAFIASGWIAAMIGFFQGSVQGDSNGLGWSLVEYSYVNAIVLAPALYGHVTAWLIFMPLERGLMEPQRSSESS